MRLTHYLITLAAGLSLTCLGQSRDDLYNHVGVLKGQVIVVNNPELGRTPASGQYFLLQRTDCSRCLIGVRADIDGRYAVYLGIGRYRVICYDPEGARADLLRRGQPREATVRMRPSDTEFNIELEIPRAR